MRKRLEAAATPQELRQREIWDGIATPEKLAQIVSERVDGQVVPTTPKQLTARMSALVGELFALRDFRRALLASSEPRTHEQQQKLDAVTGDIAMHHGQLHTLRGLAPELASIPSQRTASATTFAVGPVLSLSVPGYVAVSVHAGVMIEARDRQTGKRGVSPYINAGAGTPVAGAGYTFSKSPGRKGRSWSVSLPFVALGNSAQYGKSVALFIPGLFGLSITERGSVGGSLSVPVAPFVTAGGVLTVENPALSYMTAPIVQGMHRVVAVGEKAWHATKHLASWVAAAPRPGRAQQLAARPSAPVTAVSTVAQALADGRELMPASASPRKKLRFLLLRGHRQCRCPRASMRRHAPSSRWCWLTPLSRWAMTTRRAKSSRS